MIYNIRQTKRFQKDLKLIQKRGYEIKKLIDVVKILTNGQELPQKYRDHELHGKYAGTRECHIEPDWLLIYEKLESELILILTRTGSHSDLF